MIVLEESKKSTNPKSCVFLRSQKKVLSKIDFHLFSPYLMTQVAKNKSSGAYERGDCALLIELGCFSIG